MFTPLLEVCDAEGASAARIQGSCCPSRCFSNQQFQVEISKQPKIKHVFGQVEFILCVWLLITHQIVSNIGENVGTIWKKWPGFNDEHNMDHEYFGLEGEWFQNIFWHATICRPKLSQNMACMILFTSCFHLFPLLTTVDDHCSQLKQDISHIRARFTKKSGLSFCKSLLLQSILQLILSNWCSEF